MSKKTARLIILGMLVIIVVLLMGLIISKRTDDLGKRTVRIDGKKQVERTITAFNVGANQRVVNSLWDDSEMCIIHSAESFGGARYLTCSVSQSIESEPTSDVAKDILDYRTFYDGLLADGWSSQITIEKYYGPDSERRKQLTVQSGRQLPTDEDGDLQIRTTKQLKNGVSCSLHSSYIVPRTDSRGAVLSNGSISLAAYCRFKGSSSGIFNHPSPD